MIPSRRSTENTYANKCKTKRTARLGQSFSQQRQLSIREIYNFQSALLSHMDGLRGTA